MILLLLMIGLFVTSASAAVFDFNADGKADILWQHTTGMVAVWLMAVNGTTISSGGVPGTVSADWQIKPAPQGQLPSGPSLTGPSTVNTGLAFTLTWTYTFVGLGSTGEGYEAQESTNASFTNPTTIFNSIGQSDHQSPKNLIITAQTTAGTYY